MTVMNDDAMDQALTEVEARHYEEFVKPMMAAEEAERRKVLAPLVDLYALDPVRVGDVFVTLALVTAGDDLSPTSDTVAENIPRFQPPQTPEQVSEVLIPAALGGILDMETCQDGDEDSGASGDAWLEFRLHRSEVERMLRLGVHAWLDGYLKPVTGGRS